MFMWQSGSALGSLAALLRQLERSMGVDAARVPPFVRTDDLEGRARPRPLGVAIKHDK